MRTTTARNLESLIRSGVRVSRYSHKSAAAVFRKKPTSSPAESAAGYSSLKKFLSAINTSSKSANKSPERLLEVFKFHRSSSAENGQSIRAHQTSLVDIIEGRIQSPRENGDDESGKKLAAEVSSFLNDELDLDGKDQSEDEQLLDDVLVFPWMGNLSNDTVTLQRKELARWRKQNWVCRNTFNGRFGRLVKMCATKLGTDATLYVFGKLGKETGLKEYTELIKVCIEQARSTTDEEVSLQQIYKAYQIFKRVRENGLKIDEEMYGQFLTYLIDFGMVEEFFFFHKLIKDESSETPSRLSYYEMLLWIRVNNEVKIQELCSSVVTNDAKVDSSLHVNLLLALCDGFRKEELVMLLKTFDITKVKSHKYLMSIFKSLGRLLLENFAVKFLLDLKNNDISEENISEFICNYATNTPNLAVEDIITIFQALHSKLEVLPTSKQYENLVKYLCQASKVHDALDIAEEACKSGLKLSIMAFNSVLDACYQSCEYILVHRINSMIQEYNIEPDCETFRMMIKLYVKMKDFQGAHRMIDDMKAMELSPTANIFNVILAGYFREKNSLGAMNVLKMMEDSNVKPDAATFACLISNSPDEKHLIKNHNNMVNSGVLPTKHVFIALVNAYAAFGKLDEAKEIIKDQRIPIKNLNEIKSVLVGALSFHGHLSDALELYDEIKESDCRLDPKAVKSLIEHFQAEGELDKLIQLLNELNGSPYWFDACFRVISYCVQHDHLRCIVDLLKQLMHKFNNFEVAREVMFDEVFCFIAEKEAEDMQFGLDLLQAIKTELGVRPSRKSLDFLLSACAKTKDAKATFVIWNDYKEAGLPYNVLSFVWMYQALLASGQRAAAAKILNKITKDDPHVRCVIQACQKTYIKSPTVQMEQKSKKRALAATLGLLEGLETKTQK